jgi:hypothetical protein
MIVRFSLKSRYDNNIIFKWSSACARSRARTYIYIYVVYLVWRIFTKGVIYVRDAPLWMLPTKNHRRRRRRRRDRKRVNNCRRPYHNNNIILYVVFRVAR